MVVKKTMNSAPEESKVVGEDYFEIVKTLRQKLKDCSCGSSDTVEGDITYLWICVNSSGLEQGFGDKSGSGEKSLPMDQWLNIVDEAASLGANWLVLSLSDPLAACESVWPVSKWAQQAHGMAVGLHLKEDQSISEQDLGLIGQLEPEKTRVLMRCPTKETIEALKALGIAVWAANPQPEGEKPKCQGPTRMIFVNESGIIYTCGLVKNRDDYRMGHVSDVRLRAIISDPDIPHGVKSDLHIVDQGCDGCPALLANFFQPDE